MSELSFEIEDILAENSEKKHLDFYANVPCPIKPAFRLAYEEMAKKYHAETGEKFFSYLPSRCDATPERVKRMSDILLAESLDELPDLFFVYGLDELCNKNFADKFIRSGDFERVLTTDFSYIDADEFSDPFDCLNVYSLFSYAILIDKALIGDLPKPGSISDLLNPVYEKSISIPNFHNEIDGTFPAYIYKNFGEDGLRALDKNVVSALSTIDIMKNVGKKNEFTAPISIVSWMFANTNLVKEKAELILPSDGAICEPIVLLAKKKRAEKTNVIIDFIKSQATVSLYADNFLPVTLGNVKNKLPDGTKFQWLGWDYIFKNDMTAIFEAMCERYKGLMPE